MLTGTPNPLLPPCPEAKPSTIIGEGYCLLGWDYGRSSFSGLLLIDPDRCPHLEQTPEAQALGAWLLLNATSHS